jgi:hypothetical protein
LVETTTFVADGSLNQRVLTTHFLVFNRNDTVETSRFTRQASLIVREDRHQVPGLDGHIKCTTGGGVCGLGNRGTLGGILVISQGEVIVHVGIYRFEVDPVVVLTGDTIVKRGVTVGSTGTANLPTG